MSEKVRTSVVVSGRVQGVFFRYETQREAERRGVFGWVKNQEDGTVKAVFEGPREKVEQMIAWCNQGPPHSVVIHVDANWENYTGEFQSFDIRY